MFTSKVAALVATLTMLSVSSATCVLKNGMKSSAAEEKWPEAMCVPQAEGNYHLSYSKNSVCVPTGNGGNAMAGCAGNGGFELFDWKCKRLGTYDPSDSGNDCGVPYQIDYFPGKPITIKSVWLLSDMSYTFNYDGRDYSTKSNGLCGTHTESGVVAVGECRVGFAGPPLCTLENVRSSPSVSITDDPALCTPQNAGNIQVTMETADPPTISIYDSECREVAYFRRETAPDYCPWPIKINYLGEGREISIWKWDANQHIFAFDFKGRTYEGGFEKTRNVVSDGLGEYASKAGVYVL